MKDKFDLENEILKLHSVADNIEDIVEYLAESKADNKKVLVLDTNDPQIFHLILRDRKNNESNT